MGSTLRDAGEAARPGARAAPGPVLVLEDDPAAAEALVTGLRRAGYDVYASDEGRKGIELVEAVAPSVIVLDLHMPGMDGRTFLARHRATARGRRTPVVVVSGERAHDVDADLVLAKPVELEDVLAAVARLARRPPR